MFQYELRFLLSDLPQEIVEKSSDELSIKPGRKLLVAETEFRRMYIIRTLSNKSHHIKVVGFFICTCLLYFFNQIIKE